MKKEEEEQEVVAARTKSEPNADRAPMLWSLGCWQVCQRGEWGRVEEENPWGGDSSIKPSTLVLQEQDTHTKEGRVVVDMAMEYSGTERGEMGKWVEWGELKQRQFVQVWEGPNQEWYGLEWVLPNDWVGFD